MSTAHPSVDGGYRGSMGNSTIMNSIDKREYWNPLIRGYGPVEVFNDNENTTTTTKKRRSVLNYRQKKISNSQYNEKNNRNNRDNNNQDQRNDDPRRNNNQSNQTLTRQQRGSQWAQSTATKDSVISQNSSIEAMPRGATS